MNASDELYVVAFGCLSNSRETRAVDPWFRQSRNERRLSRSPSLGRGTNDDTTTRAMHAAQTELVDDAACDTETRARMGELDLDAQAGVAIPGLPFDVAVSLVENHLPDPADLAVLRAVSKGMRDAVDATERKIEELDEDAAAKRGFRV